MHLRPSTTIWILCSVGLVTALGGACKKEPPAATKWSGSGAAPSAPAPSMPGLPPGGMPTSPHGPTPPSPGATAPAPRGAVVETMNSGGYTYARLQIDGKDVWVAGPETKLAVGATVALAGGTLMQGFQSTTLNRTFDEIYFLASLTDAPTAPTEPTAPTGDMGGAHTPNTVVPAALAPGEKIAAAADGQTVEQIYAGKTGLAGKPVVVRGKVVKFNGGILGKNWLHLQDGSGAAGSNDLTVTTAGTAAVGDVITVRGALSLNKDFGAGYSYPVLVEDAELAAQ